MKYICLMVVMSIVTCLLPINHSEKDVLSDLNEFAKNESMNMSEWKVILKEEVPYDRLSQLKTRLLDMDHIKKEVNNESINYIYERQTAMTAFSTSYKLIIPKDKHYKAEMIAIVKGEKWNESIKNSYSVKMRTIKTDFFTKSAREFACFTTEKSDTMVKESIMKDLKNDFKMKNIEKNNDNLRQNEKMTLISGYIPMWKHYIEIRKSPVNIHMALEAKENGQTTIMVGTPILVTEY